MEEKDVQLTPNYYTCTAGDAAGYKVVQSRDLTATATIAIFTHDRLLILSAYSSDRDIEAPALD